MWHVRNLMTVLSRICKSALSLIPWEHVHKLARPRMLSPSVCVCSTALALVLWLHLPGSSVAQQVAKELPCTAPDPHWRGPGAGGPSHGGGSPEHLSPAPPGAAGLTGSSPGFGIIPGAHRDSPSWDSSRICIFLSWLNLSRRVALY